MTERPTDAPLWQRSSGQLARLKSRHRAERRFKAYGIAALVTAAGFLFLLLGGIAYKAHPAFLQTSIELSVYFDPAVIDPEGTHEPEVLRRADYGALISRSLAELFPEVTERKEKRALQKLVSPSARHELRALLLDDPGLIGRTERISFPAASDLDMLIKGQIARDVPETERRLSDRQIAWIDALDEQGAIDLGFNHRFFTNADSRYPETAGIWGAVVGSFFTLLMTLVLAFPIGVASAIYLEEFAPKNRWTDFIEVNVNNLAAVPSIIFGLLGLAIFLQVFELPRSAPIVGGLTLMLMTLPTIIITTRAALGAVPPSIREAAYGIGASPMQVVTQHVLPLALPGILTGTIIGMARALGETAPLLMIGMVAFIMEIPEGPFDPATVLPVQVFLWADRPERGFLEKTSAAIIVLLVFLIAMNAIAIYLRKRFEKKW
ncbi:MAG: phosphate ABC transporter permease PstA [Proteobacteria bacterium]|nr:phosphate ABC transporter permease PstA [Pseudomonadota bacterium]